MFAGRLSTTDSLTATTDSLTTTAETIKTAMKERFFETRFFTFEEWKSKMNYAVYFQCQKFLAKEIQRINNGEKKVHKPITTQIPTTISTKKPENITFPYFPKFG